MTELCPDSTLGTTGARAFGFYYNSNRNRSTPLIPTEDVLLRSWEAKRELIARHPEGSTIEEFQWCSRPPLVAQWDAEMTLFLLLGALWAGGLPFVEVLAWLGPCTPSRFMNQCVSEPPRVLPVCEFPSGETRTAAAYWPTRRYARLHGYPVRITSVRFFCPVPEGEDLAGNDRFTIILRHPSGKAVPVPLCRNKEKVGLVVACPQPLWGFNNMNTRYPNLVHEWLAYHKLIGFHRFNVYDLFGEFDEPLRPWRDIGFVRSFPTFPPHFLRPPQGKNMAGREYCTESIAHDHCLFTNQLTSRWAQLLHAPDNFVMFRDSPAIPHGMATLLGKHDATAEGELLMMTVPCGGIPLGVNISILLTFDTCGKVLYMRRETPILSCLNVLSTEVHISGSIQPNLKRLRRKCLIDPLKYATAHYMQMFPRAQWKLVNSTYGKHSPMLKNAWPQVNDVVRQVVPADQLVQAAPAA
eukprot:TRINITY_DN93627_c0_g1_i1.p1 TRINITY_DN93627_c0_g1~~TRINITY_DN93627_c0_g1_i1.p1  ORF type:complete len:475 (+),score=48.12 TRINITY_DN93627_c0_g1_i1:23-1426(+)